MIDNIALEIHDLTVQYQHRPVVWGVDLTIPEGVLCAIVGPNGAGKSTLLKASLGLIPAASGYAKFFGKDLAQIQPRVAYVPQREEIDWDFPIKVGDVVLMGRYGYLKFWQSVTAHDRALVNLALERVGMSSFYNRLIRELSGGQQQRVFLARALAQEADLYLMDEPFAGIDAATEGTLLQIFDELVKEGKTVICVHHDLHTVYEEFSHTVLLNLRLIGVGKTKEVLTEEALRSAYGGNLTILSALIEKMRDKSWVKRETSSE